MNYNKDIKFSSKNLIDITLKIGEYIKKAQRHHLVFEMAASDTKSYFPFVIFSDSYPMIGTSKIQLGKSLNLA